MSVEERGRGNRELEVRAVRGIRKSLKYFIDL
jgi:hypothetical protein